MSILSNITEGLKIMAYVYVMAVAVFIFALLAAVIIAGAVQLFSSILGA